MRALTFSGTSALMLNYVIQRDFPRLQLFCYGRTKVTDFARQHHAALPPHPLTQSQNRVLFKGTLRFPIFPDTLAQRLELFLGLPRQEPAEIASMPKGVLVSRPFRGTRTLRRFRSTRAGRGIRGTHTIRRIRSTRASRRFICRWLDCDWLDTTSIGLMSRSARLFRGPAALVLRFCD